MNIENLLRKSSLHEISSGLVQLCVQHFRINLRVLDRGMSL
jgi:hypothetical protein